MTFEHRILNNLHPTMATFKYIALSFILLSISVCGSRHDPHAHCVESGTIECSPLYPPIFEEVYANTLASKCAIGGTSCHGDGAAAFSGLDLSGSADDAYAALMTPESVEPYIMPGDFLCGHLIYHLESNTPGVMMPPGTQLTEEERCAIRQWIASGALRTENEAKDVDEGHRP